MIDRTRMTAQQAMNGHQNGDNSSENQVPMHDRNNQNDDPTSCRTKTRMWRTALSDA